MQAVLTITPRLFNIKDTARYSRVSTRCIQRLKYGRALPYIQLPACRWHLYDRVDLDALADALKRDA